MKLWQIAVLYLGLITITIELLTLTLLTYAKAL